MVSPRDVPLRITRQSQANSHMGQRQRSQQKNKVEVAGSRLGPNVVSFEFGVCPASPFDVVAAQWCPFPFVGVQGSLMKP